MCLEVQQFFDHLFQKHALMAQVAHQTIVMQFILELSKSLSVDPRACFRQFFTKIKVSLLPRAGNIFLTSILASQLDDHYLVGQGQNPVVTAQAVMKEIQSAHCLILCSLSE